MFWMILGLPLVSRLWLLLWFVVWSLACVTGGYAYRWHQDGLKTAVIEATQTTAQTTVEAGAKASDAATVDALKTQLTTAQATTAGLLKYIKELQGAQTKTAGDAVCRIPDGLRAAINANLAAR